MPFIHRLSKRERNAGTHPDQRGFLDAELRGDLVSRAEATAADVAGQAVRVF